MEQTQINLKQNSIEVNKNSKGYTYSVKLYYENESESDNIIKKIKEIDNKLKLEFGGNE